MQPMTTKANLQIHERSMDPVELPKTFTDAIAVTRKLGVKYLWIDALCIIQDSDEDRAVECSKMGMYYRNSYLTISALDASNSSDGFLNRRLPVPQANLFEGQDLQLRPKTLTRAAIFQKSPLGKRGWTLQERLLSTRVLHYGETEIFWECFTCSCREGTTKEHKGNEDVRDLASSEGEDFKRLTLATSADPKEPDCGAFALWYRIIRQFSQRLLTYQDDALPAIAGLAASIASKHNLRYIAGLWAEDLDGLLWQVEQSTFYDNKQTLAKNYHKRVAGLPTWSWASLSQAVRYPFIYEHRTLSRISALFATANLGVEPTNPFGKLTGGSLKLRGLLARSIHCSFNKTRLQQRDDFNRLNDMQVGVHRQWEPGTFAPRSGTGYFDERATYDAVYVSKEELYYYDYQKSMAERKRLDATTEFALLGITERVLYAVQSVGEGVTVAASKIYFLIVLPDTARTGCWRRVGMGWTSETRFFEGCEPEEVELV